MDAAVAEVRRTVGRIDILVNGAGIALGGPIDGEQYIDAWHQSLAVDLPG